MECSPDGGRRLCPMHLCTAASDLHLDCGTALSFEDHSLANSTDTPLATRLLQKRTRRDPRGLGSADLSRGALGHAELSLQVAGWRFVPHAPIRRDQLLETPLRVVMG
jgi:hypothetical protein